MLTSWFLDSATARELGLATTGHAQRGVSSTPSPGPSNLHLSAGTVTPDALMADIADGFYVTDLIGMGVNQVTGDYSRGASGFWIENGKRSYPVSEVTIAGNLIDMFKALVARERSRVPFRHQRADRARGGADRWRPMSRGIDRAEVRDRLAAAVREAGALALQTFRGELKSWTKGKSSPVSEADLAVDALLRERLLAIHDAGWLSEETEDDPARLQRADVWVVDPIDGTRAYLAGLPDWAISVALVHAGRPVVAALYAPVTDELFLSIAGSGATLNGVPIKASTGDRIAEAKFSGPSAGSRVSATIEPRIQTMPRVPSLALRLARVATGALDGAFAGPRTATIGTLRQPTFWCTKPAG